MFLGDRGDTGDISCPPKNFNRISTSNIFGVGNIPLIPLIPKKHHSSPTGTKDALFHQGATSKDRRTNEPSENDMNKICPKCKETFEADEPWKRLCLECWIENKNSKPGAVSRPDPLIQKEFELSKLRRELFNTTQELHRANDTARTLSRQIQRMNTPAIPGEMMRRLLQLAHPDKHGGSDAATTATKWLLSQRR